MDPTTLREKRAKNFYAVRDMHATLRACPKPTLSKSDFDACKVSVKISDLDLNTGTTTDSGPQYGTPYPSQRLDVQFKTASMVPFPTCRDRGEYLAAYEIRLFLQKCLVALAGNPKLGYDIKWKRTG